MGDEQEGSRQWAVTGAGRGAEGCWSAELARLRQLPPPSHRRGDGRTTYPPDRLADVYARGQYGLTLMESPPVHAAVLVPLLVVHAAGGGEAGGELRVLLTLRARGLRRHGGEVALPGGKRDPALDHPSTGSPPVSPCGDHCFCPCSPSDGVVGWG
jgi:hypothetical protein